MLVTHLCYYLTDWNGITPRSEDYNTNKVVKSLKGETIKGYSNIVIGGVSFRLTDSNKDEFLRRLWVRVGQVLNEHLATQTAIVPIPNSDGIVGAAATYRTLVFANAIAAASSKKVVAVDALRWKAVAASVHKQGGFRAPEPRYENLEVIQCPKLPIILFDDVITSGSSFIAAYWRLDEAGNAPKEGFVIARRTALQEPKMFIDEQKELEIPSRPLF
jgi:orotate phosphoribosyltransferase